MGRRDILFNEFDGQFFYYVSIRAFLGKIQYSYFILMVKVNNDSIVMERFMIQLDTQSRVVLDAGRKYDLRYFEFSVGQCSSVVQETYGNAVFYEKLHDVFLSRKRLYSKIENSLLYKYSGRSRETLYSQKIPDFNKFDVLETGAGDSFVLVDRTNEANYFHWMCQVLPAFDALQKNADLNKTVFLFYTLNSWQRKTLSYLADKECRIIEVCPTKNLFLKEVWICSLSLRNASDTQKEAWFKTESKFFFFADKIKKDINAFETNSLNYPKIYLSRASKDVTRRVIGNEAEIEAMLEKLGFVIVKPTEYSFEQQVHIFSNAEIIIGPTGAAFANLIFCNKQAKVGIIQPASLKNYCGGYATFSQMLGLQSFVYNERNSGKPDIHEGYMVTLSHFSFFVDKLLSNDLHANSSEECYIAQNWALKL